jgi:dienelactone hydrolase
MKIRSYHRWIFSIVFLPVIFLCIIAAISSLREYSGYFQTRRGVLSDIRQSNDSSHTKYWITLRNTDGFTVECGLLLPRAVGKRFPLLVLLGGKATGKYAIDYALDIDNIIILALDYPYEPRESYTLWTIVQDIPKVRRALIDMVPESLLALDYLFQRKDVDTTKVVLLGYSFGAPLVPAISVIDRRITVAVMVYGGGELHSLIRHNVGRYKGQLLSEFVGSLSGVLLRPLEPMRYADKISPTPLLMINGVNDEQIPRYNTETFFNAAHEPKKLIWMDSKHVNVNNPDLTRKIILTLKEELKRLKILGITE